MIYNDTSVLENHHTSTLYGLLASSPDADVLGSLDDGTWRMVRKIVNAAIAHTDMSFHFKMVSQAEIFLELHAQSISLAHTGDPEANKRAFANQDDRVFMMNLLLHSADISNPAKPFGIYDKWTTSVLEEFFAQGDLEKEMGLPVSPGFDRVTTSRAGSQINFIEFVLTPMFATVIRIFPVGNACIGDGFCLWRRLERWRAMRRLMPPPCLIRSPHPTSPPAPLPRLAGAGTADAEPGGQQAEVRAHLRR